MLEAADVARPEMDMLHVPLTALGRRSRELLWALLDPKKVIPTPSRLQRDWCGLAALAEIPGQYYPSIYNSTDCGPTEKVLRLWSQHNSNTATVGKLQEFLKALDRWDVYDDTFDLFAEDARLYWKQQEKPVPISLSPHSDHITYEDATLWESGSTEVQRYHAYVLYAKQDYKFAKKMMEELRSRGYWICCEENLLYGFTTEMGPVTRLISERCDHIIVIYSPDFLESEANKFYMDYAQALGIKTNTRKLVPCVYRECQLPSNYSFYHMLYYNEEGNGVRTMFNFWDKLSKSLVNSRLPRARITEVGGCESSHGPTPPAICNGSPAMTDSVSTRAAPSQPELQLPSIPADLDSLTISEPPISELSISNKKPNIFKKIFKLKKSKSKKHKTKELLKAVSSAV